MKESFRWYGVKDPVSLSAIRQAGATHIVSALHHIPNGEIWTLAEIQAHKDRIESAGLKWAVVESIPIHEDIKQQKPTAQKYISHYKKSIQNLAQCGIHIICYNFMPVLDWTRTHLNKTMTDGSKALALEIDALHAFDLFIAQREEAKKDYDKQTIVTAKAYFESLDQKDQKILTNSIIAGLPGAEEGYDLNQFNAQVAEYKNITSDQLREALISFLKEIIPTAEAVNSFMCIHPDDPPFSLFGIPRIVSTAFDLEAIFNAVPSIHNGLTFCSGSFGVRPDNNLLDLFTTYAERIHFLHFRSTQRDVYGNFHEADHLGGDVDMFVLVQAALKEEKRRKISGRADSQIPMRPDHGHQMLDDLQKRTNPGYSAIGRLRGLAELRGLALGITRGGLI
jgi:mannonate dehydratase